MTGRALREKLNYIGMERAIRRLALGICEFLRRKRGANIRTKTGNKRHGEVNMSELISRQTD